MLLKKHIPVGYVVSTVWRDALLLTLITAVLYAFHHFDRAGWFTVPLPLLAVLGTAISLLLAFRTNQSYERWWEARIIWGAIVNDSRSLVRQVLAFPNAASRGEVQDIMRRIGLRQAAWCYVLSRSLRGQPQLSDLEDLLEPGERKDLERFDNKPNAMLLNHSHDLQHLLDVGAIDSIQLTQIDETVSRLCDHMGKCERIKSTVFPVTYSMFLRAYIYLFVFLIPFSLAADFGLSEIPLASSIGVAFFIIEKTATLMQDPFENRPTDTAMNAISTNIHRAIAQMLDLHSRQPEPAKSGPFYAM